MELVENPKTRNPDLKNRTGFAYPIAVSVPQWGVPR